MGFFRLCSGDPVTIALRNTFQATPLKVPETRVKPLNIIARKGKKTDFWGGLSHLLEGERQLRIKFQESTLANLTIEKTKSVKLDFGLKLLSGFLKGFGIPEAPIEGGLDGARDISFSFTNTKRLYVEPAFLGRKLIGKKMDFQNPALGIFLRDDPYDMHLITSVIVSNGFKVHVDKKAKVDFAVDIPAIQKAIGNVSTKIDAGTSDTSTISFHGDEFLTFAFSCIKLEVDKATRTIRMGEIVPTKSAEGVETEEYIAPEEEAMVDDPQFVDMIEF